MIIRQRATNKLKSLKKLVDDWRQKKFAAESLTGWLMCKKSTHLCGVLILKVPRTKIVDFSNNVDPDEVAHNEPPHLDLHCLSSSL